MQLQGASIACQRADAVILGGGPAGATAALILARAGLSVRLVERSEEAAWKIGEGLPPVAKTLLTQLGLWPRFLADGHVPSHGNRSAWGTAAASEQNFIFNPYGSAWHVDRSRFDSMLLHAAREAGALIERPASVADGRKKTNGRWELQILSKGAPKLIETDFVVDAGGRSSWFARRQGAKRQRFDNLIGVVARLAPKMPLDDATTLVEAAQSGWWYSALIPSGHIVVAFMSDADTMAAKEITTADGWRKLLSRSPHTRERVEGHQCRFDVAPRIVSANSACLNKSAGEGWLAAGDAAASFDPLSSQGILTALATGSYAAQSIQSYFNGKAKALDLYAAQLQLAYREYMKNRTAYYRVEQRWPDSLFWRRRRQTLAVVREGMEI